ncbi:hypothetical protein KAT92_03150 [Candidatus Babeliales bacterium]|nr:hypothetical protein [Candidatus Babeliales bacterium]
MKTYKSFLMLVGMLLATSHGMAMETAVEVRRHRRQRSCSAPITIPEPHEKTTEEFTAGEKLENLIRYCIQWEMLSEEEINFLDENGYSKERYKTSTKPQRRNYSCPVTPNEDSHNSNSPKLNITEIENNRLRANRQRRLTPDKQIHFSAPTTPRIISIQKASPRRCSEPATPRDYDDWDMDDILFGVTQVEIETPINDKKFNNILDSIHKIIEKQLSCSNKEFKTAKKLREILITNLEELRALYLGDQNKELVRDDIFAIYHKYPLDAKKIPEYARSSLLHILKTKTTYSKGYGEMMWKRSGGPEWERKEENKGMNYAYNELQTLFSQQPVNANSAE